MHTPRDKTRALIQQQCCELCATHHPNEGDRKMKSKLTILLTAFLVAAVFLPVSAANDPRVYEPLDGVPIRQGSEVIWTGAGEMRADPGDEEVAYVWSDTRTGYRGIYIQVIKKDGSFTFAPNGLQVINPPHPLKDPVVHPSSDGGWFVAWKDCSADPEGDIFCTKLDRDGNMLWLGPNNYGVPVCTVNQPQTDLHVTADLNGGCIVAWRDFRAGFGGDIYAMHVKDGSVDPEWTLDGEAICTAPAEQSSITTTGDGVGGMIISWQDNRNQDGFNIWAQRITSAGDLLWGAERAGILVCADPEYQTQPDICPDGLGGAFLSWVDWRNRNESGHDIYIQRINTDGATYWAEDGEPLCTAPGIQQYCQIVPSEQGSAIISWEDERTPQLPDWNVDIYAMRISGEEALEKEWGPEQGVPICVSPRTQDELSLSPDGSGGAFLVWTDQRNNVFPDLEIYAQHIFWDGGFAWEQSGIPIVALTEWVDQPVVRYISDGSAAVVWQDNSTGSANLVAQLMDPDDAFLKFGASGKNIVSTIGGSIYGVTLLGDGNGKAVVTYNDGRRGHHGYMPYYQMIEDRNDSANILLEPQGNPAKITDTPGGVGSLSSAMDGDGNVFTAWEDHTAGIPYAIRVQKISPDGELLWGETGNLVTEPLPGGCEQYNPKAVPDGEGGVIVLFQNTDEDWYQYLFAQRLDSEGEPLWAPEGIPITNDQLFNHMEAVLADNQNGGAVVVWSVLDENTFETDLYMTRIGLDGVLDLNFNVNGEGALPLCIERGDQTDVRITPHPDGYALVWEDERNDIDLKTDIFGQVVDFEGNIIWIANGWSICGDEASQARPDLTVDPQGNIWVCWEDYRNVDHDSSVDIYMQKLASPKAEQAEELFLPNGIPLSNAPRLQCSATLTGDGQDGIWCVWEDFRHDEYGDIFAVHLNSKGVPVDSTYYIHDGVWGAPVTTARGGQSTPRLVPVSVDGSRGVFVTWNDDRGSIGEDQSNPQLYLQRLYDGFENNISGTQIAVPSGYELYAPYPNPFNSTTVINYALPQQCDVQISLFDPLGRLVEDYGTVNQKAGTHRIVMNVSHLPTSSYFIRLKAGSVQLERQIQLIK